VPRGPSHGAVVALRKKKTRWNWGVAVRHPDQLTTTRETTSMSHHDAHGRGVRGAPLLRCKVERRWFCVGGRPQVGLTREVNREYRECQFAQSHNSTFLPGDIFEGRQHVQYHNYCGSTADNEWL